MAFAPVSIQLPTSRLSEDAEYGVSERVRHLLTDLPYQFVSVYYCGTSLTLPYITVRYDRDGDFGLITGWFIVNPPTPVDVHAKELLFDNDVKWEKDSHGLFVRVNPIPVELKAEIEMMIGFYQKITIQECLTRHGCPLDGEIVVHLDGDVSVHLFCDLSKCYVVCEREKQVSALLVCAVAISINRLQGYPDVEPIARGIAMTLETTPGMYEQIDILRQSRAP